MAEEDKKLVFEIDLPERGKRRAGGAQLIVDNYEQVKDAIELELDDIAGEMKAGDEPQRLQVTITTKWMDREEFNNLPEFDGWS